MVEGAVAWVGSLALALRLAVTAALLAIGFRWRRGVTLLCPRDLELAHVQLSLGSLVRTLFPAKGSAPRLNVQRCRLWPMRLGCNRACIDSPGRPLRQAVSPHAKPTCVIHR